MWDKFTRALRKMHRSQKGISGLETAIILIAFVTVASVLGYSVLSAGIFSAERGKATVYQGLAQAQASMEVRGSVLAISSDNTSVDSLVFTLASVLDDESTDMTVPPDNVTVINYSDKLVHDEDITWTKAVLGTERGDVDMLEADEQMQVTVTIPDTATLEAYGTFSLQIVPPKGATITIKRTLPGALSAITDLN